MKQKRKRETKQLLKDKKLKIRDDAIRCENVEAEKDIAKTAKVAEEEKKKDGYINKLLEQKLSPLLSEKLKKNLTSSQVACRP